MSTEERNKQIKDILEKAYITALDTNQAQDDQEFHEPLEKLFSTTAWGFREILLVVLVAMKLDKEFKASTGLYDCNPRAIYEGPIKEFLIENRIPHRKSGPLNVAKATVGLDMTWAAQRRPSAVAEKVVWLVNYVEASKSKRKQRVDSVLVALLRKLANETERLDELNVEIEFSSDPEFLYDVCYQLILETPDSGNTPQKIAAYLLKNYHCAINSGVLVTGEEDRASVTSTTSKKPGDVNEESANGEIYKVYEITIKPFDLARIRDSFDCVSRYNESNNSVLNEIIVICRKSDCPEEMVKSSLR